MKIKPETQQIQGVNDALAEVRPWAWLDDRGNTTTSREVADDWSEEGRQVWPLAPISALARQQAEPAKAEIVAAAQPAQHALAVWFDAMPETNGKKNWTVILHRKDQGIEDGITIGRSEYHDRERYEADRLRFLIGEIPEEPWVLDYDADLLDPGAVSKTKKAKP
jgi:hypothetical protein